MVAQPHPDAADSAIALNCAVLTVSDTRTPATDKSGQLAQERLGGAGHRIAEYQILPDEPEAIATLVQQWCEPSSEQAGVDVIILSGGTGIAPGIRPMRRSLRCSRKPSPVLANYFVASAIRKLDRGR